jgi:hypothetical protein
MRAATVRRKPTPADQRRVAVARERVAYHMGGMLAGLDVETQIETCRVVIRAAAQIAKQVGGEGRASGVLCGALVDVSPAFRDMRPAMAEAETLFSKPGPANSEATPGPKSAPVAAFEQPSATCIASSLKSASAAKFSGGDQ